MRVRLVRFCCITLALSFSIISPFLVFYMGQKSSKSRKRSQIVNERRRENVEPTANLLIKASTFTDIKPIENGPPMEVVPPPVPSAPALTEGDLRQLILEKISEFNTDQDFKKEVLKALKTDGHRVVVLVFLHLIRVCFFFKDFSSPLTYRKFRVRDGEACLTNKTSNGVTSLSSFCPCCRKPVDVKIREGRTQALYFTLIQ